MHILDTILPYLDLALQEPWFIASVLSLAFMLMLLLKVMSRPKDIEVSRNDWGTVTIGRKALEGFIQSNCSAVEGVERIRLLIRKKGRRIHLTLKLHVSRSALSDLSARLQEHLHRLLEEELGLSHLGSINIFVVEMRTRSSDLKDEAVTL